MPPTRKKNESDAAAAAPGIDEVLGYRLALATLTTASVFFREVGDPLQLRPVEYTILALIREAPGVTPARLAKALAVTAPNITAWMAKLESRGLVERTASDTDRRAQLLSLTPAGDRLSVNATRRLVAAERAALASLSPGEYTLLHELLRKVAAARVDA
jgi:DNA-binding MarR family transcriptional regulator